MTARKRIAQPTDVISSSNRRTTPDIGGEASPNHVDERHERRGSAFIAQYNIESVLSAIARMEEGGIEIRVFRADLVHSAFRNLRTARLLSTLRHQPDSTLIPPLHVSTQVH